MILLGELLRIFSKN